MCVWRDEGLLVCVCVCVCVRRGAITPKKGACERAKLGSKPECEGCEGGL